ncbi:MAG: radical SAM protein [Thermoplasmata archaeon]|nr:radical SAM protein [Thermoplasmata archaeon]
MKEKWCKSALTISRLPGIDYSLNPYVGCQHGCVYCYVPNVLRMEREEWKHNLYAKINMPAVLRKELKVKRRGVVGISTSTDAYQPAERKYEITRNCLLLLAKYDWPVDILTKSDMVLRDVDILTKMSHVKVGFTIPTLNDEMRKHLEPNAPSIERRLKALKQLSEMEIYTYVFAGPLFPLPEYEIREYLEAFIDVGAREIILDNFHLKEGVMDAVRDALPPEMREWFMGELNRKYVEKVFSEMVKLSDRRVEIRRAF